MKQKPFKVLLPILLAFFVTGTSLAQQSTKVSKLRPFSAGSAEKHFIINGTLDGIKDNVKTKAIGMKRKIVSANIPIISRVNASRSSVKLSSRGAIQPDWKASFDSEEEFNQFTVYDANNDGSFWTYASYMNSAKSAYDGETGNDDWLFTPPLNLEAGRTYNVSFDVSDGSYSFQNTLEVKWGTDTLPVSMNHTLLETTSPSDDWTTYNYELSVDTDGVYYIGFHDNTSAVNQMFLYIDNVSVVKGPLGSSPQAVTDLILTPASEGQLSASLSFKVNTKNINGDSLSGVDSIQINRDGEKIFTTTSKKAGETVQYTDSNVPTHGMHEYTVIPYISDEFGKAVTISAYIGQDVPLPPHDVLLNDNGNNILATWDKFPETGINGSFVDSKKISVTFYTIDDYGYIGDSIASSNLGENQLVIQQSPDQSTNVDNKTQTLYRLAASASSPGGTSDFSGTNSIVIGPSLSIPYEESFKGGSLDNSFAWTQGNTQVVNNENSSTWRIDNSISSDNGGGSVTWSAYSADNYGEIIDYIVTKGDETSFNTPKISIKGASNPKLYFKAYAIANDSARLEVLVQTPDGVNNILKTIDLTSNNKNGWTTYAIDLKNYSKERYVIVKINGIALGSNVNISIDDINLIDQYDSNLAAVGITAPEEITAGKVGDVDVYVKNYGLSSVKDYNVVLMSGTNLVDTVTVNKELPSLNTDTVRLHVPVFINDFDSLYVKAIVQYAADLNEKDDTTYTKTIKIIPSQYQSIFDLKAAREGNSILLNWSEPQKPEPKVITDDFESYTPFSTKLGEWKLIDGDKGLAWNIFPDYPYPCEGTAFAFCAFNPNAITDDFDVVENNPGLSPHSGNQYAGAPYVVSQDGESYIAPNNWMISPELSGKAQKIKFYAMNIVGQDEDNTYAYNEAFDVLSSTTTADTTSFVKLQSCVANGTTTINEGANWKEFTIDIPEGTKYFAIHHNSSVENNYLFGIDDVSYEKLPVGANDSIVSYKIYRDNKNIGSVNGKTLSFSDNELECGDHVYNVTVVYKSHDGIYNESGFSNQASVSITGIKRLEAKQDNTYNVYTIDGKLIKQNSRNMNELGKGIYIINNRKYVVR